MQQFLWCIAWRVRRPRAWRAQPAERRRVQHWKPGWTIVQEQALWRRQPYRWNTPFRPKLKPEPIQHRNGEKESRQRSLHIDSANATCQPSPEGLGLTEVLLV